MVDLCREGLHLQCMHKGDATTQAKQEYTKRRHLSLEEWSVQSLSQKLTVGFDSELSEPPMLVCHVESDCWSCQIA